MSDEGQTITRQEQETIDEENLIENTVEEESDEKIIFKYSIPSPVMERTIPLIVLLDASKTAAYMSLHSKGLMCGKFRRPPVLSNLFC